MYQNINNNISLQIIQPQDKINFSNSNDSSILNFTRQKDQDILKDQSSLSFSIQIQNQNKLPFVINHTDHDLLKKKFNQIFDKYKLPTLKVEENVPTATHQQNDIMKTFDEIFVSFTPRNTSQGGQGRQSPMSSNNFFRKPNRQQTSILAQTRLKSEDQTNINFTPQKKMKKKQQNYFKVQFPQNDKKTQMLRTPPQLKKYKQKQYNNNISSQNIPQQQYRLSLIQNKQQLEISNNSFSISQMLKTQIFKYKENNKDSDKNIKGETDKVNEQKCLPIPILIKESKQQAQANMGLSRFSDMYQRIDMSQSIAMKDMQYKYNEPTNFLANESLASLKIISKSGSSNTIDYQQYTLINDLCSNRNIQAFDENLQVPRFMRKAVWLNSRTPNLANPKILQKQNEHLQQIIKNFSNTLNDLQKMQKIIKQKDKLKKQILQIFSTGINLIKFKTCNWEKCLFIDKIRQYQPTVNWNVRQWDQNKVNKALQSYKKVGQKHFGIQLNLKSQADRRRYFEIRQKYWDIQRNILKITYDIYTHALSLGFPTHYKQFKQILQQQQIIFSQPQIRIKKMQLQKIKRLRNKGDPLSLSEVGLKVISKLTNLIKFNSNNY